MVVPGPPFQSPGLFGTASFTSPVLMTATQLGPLGSLLPSITGRLVFNVSSSFTASDESALLGLDEASPFVSAAAVGNSRCSTAPSNASTIAHATVIMIVRFNVL